MGKLATLALVGSFVLASAAKPIQEFTAHGTDVEGKSRTEVGTDVLWAVFAVFTVSTIIFQIWSTNAAEQAKKFYYLTSAVTAAAALSYLTMAVGSFMGVTNGREFAPARYVDWLVTTPLLLLDLGLLAGISQADLGALVAADVLMVAAGTAAAYAGTTVGRWSLYTFSCVVMLPVVIAVVTKLRDAAENKGEEVEDRFNALAWLTFATWLMYPIIWGIGEGSHVISVDLEIILYAILDVIAKAVFGFILLTNHEALHLPKAVPQSIQLPLTYQA